MSTLTGTQVMLLVASETGHVYTFATRKLQPMITSESGKALIQTCLNSPDPSPAQITHSDNGILPESSSVSVLGGNSRTVVGNEDPEIAYTTRDEEMKVWRSTFSFVLFHGFLKNKVKFLLHHPQIGLDCIIFIILS